MCFVAAVKLVQQLRCFSVLEFITFVSWKPFESVSCDTSRYVNCGTTCRCESDYLLGSLQNYLATVFLAEWWEEGTPSILEGDLPLPSTPLQISCLYDSQSVPPRPFFVHSCRGGLQLQIHTKYILVLGYNSSSLAIGGNLGCTETRWISHFFIAEQLEIALGANPSNISPCHQWKKSGSSRTVFRMSHVRFF